MRFFTLSLVAAWSAADDAAMWRPPRLAVRNESGALYYYLDGEPVSPWHDIPFLAGADSATNRPLLSFVCEIPRGTRAKFEIHKTEPHNPLVQYIYI